MPSNEVHPVSTRLDQKPANHRAGCNKDRDVGADARDIVDIIPVSQSGLEWLAEQEAFACTPVRPVDQAMCETGPDRVFDQAPTLQRPRSLVLIRP